VEQRVNAKIKERGLRFLKVIFLVCASTALASAGSILNGWGFNIDGVFTGFNQVTTATISDFPAEAINPGTTIDVGSIDSAFPQNGTGTGLGDIVVTLSTPGTHKVIVFLDAELGSVGDGFWYGNEYGSSLSLGSPTSGLSWEIDELGYGGTCNTNVPEDCYSGNLFNDVVSGTLTNSNNPLSVGLGTVDHPVDVSLALGLTINLAATQTARLTFTAGLLAGSDTSSLLSGFYLTQRNSNPASDTYWFKVASQIDSPPADAPEPGTWVLLLTGSALIAVARFRLQRRPGKI
jgi:hypothetical protein